MENNLQATQRRAIQYWFVDGLAELGGGAIALLLVIYFVALQIFPALSNNFVFPYLLLFLAAFGINRFLLEFRKKSTYQRTGYIEPSKSHKYRWLVYASIAFTLLLLGFMFYTVQRNIDIASWMPVIGGMIFAFIFFLAGYRARIVRLHYLAILCLLIGFILVFIGIGGNWGVALLSLVTSLVLFAFGVITRLRYLHQTGLKNE
jgi:hypothetical protein